MAAIDPNTYYTFEKECVYKGETYLVRDNGAILRKSKPGGKNRQMDNIWTFGKPNWNRGYMEWSSESIHRVVAFAFHGQPPTSEHVVDHIDTNRANNRPENLRWVTKLENILLNTITCQRIAKVCGSVEAFLENPAAFRDHFQEPNFSWMCTVSPEDSKLSLERLEKWAKSDAALQGYKLGPWLFMRSNGGNTLRYVEPPENIQAINPNAVQRNWKTVSEFPCCPSEPGNLPILAYYQSLERGAVFCTNSLFTSLVFDFALSKDESIFFIMTKAHEEGSIKDWALASVSFDDGKFIHSSLGTFFSIEGAQKEFTLAQGLQWTGADSIDDYC